ncbi:MAG: diacylglycerol kinase [Crocinitomicaceae bacterium]|jgi:diacylglycerol kinase|nr:diacylglycerol kinase [Crocinitomicaceae bacterium]
MKPLFKRFFFAFEGLKFLVFGDRSIRLHLFFLGIAVLLGFWLKISAYEWLAVILCSALVICFEALNTVLERLANFMSREIHPEIKIIKDASAAVVLLACLFALAIGAIIFIPKILSVLM